ncbi:potassium channel family protein [Candidatus Nitrospira bockiana]
MKALTKSFRSRTLFTPADLAPGKTILMRIGLVLALIGMVILVLWLDRGGLRDSTDGEVSFADVLYFSMVTITTVGYGDIVPITPRARLIDTFFVTPIRIFIWFIFLGTAYELVIRQYLEGYRMRRIQGSLSGHVLVCGFGYTGFSAVKELIAKGTSASKIVVIDPNEDRVKAAIEQGVIALRADATNEAVLQGAALAKAKAAIIAVGRDDTAALILLTARHLNPDVRIMVSVNEEENIKLLRQGGASVTISPSTFGGYILAAAVDQMHLVEYLEDLLTAGGRITLTERPAKPEEIGKAAADFLPNILLRIYRQGEVLSLRDLQEKERVRAGDVLLLLMQIGDGPQASVHR